MPNNVKERHEQEVFRNFVKTAKLDVDGDSICSESPPLPDISCQMMGKQHYFELTRASDQKISDETGYLLKTSKSTGEGGVGKAISYDDREMLRAAVKRKMNKKYETGKTPIDLLVYYDGLSPSPLPELIESTFRELQSEFHNRWHKIWLYDWSNDRVLFNSTTLP